MGVKGVQIGRILNIFSLFLEKFWGRTKYLSSMLN